MFPTALDRVRLSAYSTSRDRRARLRTIVSAFMHGEVELSHEALLTEMKSPFMSSDAPGEPRSGVTQRHGTIGRQKPAAF